MKLALHNYWRSSASHRVRIGLELKRLPYDYVVVNILNRDQHADAYRAKNPMGQVPTLEVTEDDGTVCSIGQSLPILEYLEERFTGAGSVPLLPREPYLRARVRGIAEIINSGIQPFQNLSTVVRVKAFGGDDLAWVRAFVGDGLTAVARAVAATAGNFCVGDAPTVADCCLVPQLASARRFQVEVGSFSQLLEIEQHCLALPAFAAAAPDRQPDAVKP